METLASVFEGASVFTGSGVGNWDVSSVQTLNSAFTDAAEFVEDLSSWNVAAVTDTSFAFRGAAKFDHNLGSWLVGKVQIDFQMFYDATAFQGIGLGSWDVSKVTEFQLM